MILVRVNNLSLSIQTQKVFRQVSFNLMKGEHYAVVGPSGSGKTTLLRVLAGRVFQTGAVQKTPGIQTTLVEQQHIFKNLSNTSSFYYQQRFNASDGDDAMSVAEYLEQELSLYEASQQNEVQKLLHLLSVDKLLERKLIQLSNGENKRVQLVKALLLKPDILLLDNAFIGLDQEARKKLSDLLEAISKKEITIVLVTSGNHIPVFVTKVVQLTMDGDLQVVNRQDFVNKSYGLHLSIDLVLLQRLMNDGEAADFNTAVCMKNVTIRYAGKTILENINWQVKKGERWSLSGPNGAGKSTLFSLISADNPQAYANEIYLFDKRRGTGESIWDIKKRIGYVSPELHLYFESSTSVFEAVASGLFDTIGLFRVLNEEQAEKVLGWLRLLGIEKLRTQLLRNLPSGIQRLTLLARALVKNPSLLLLDEPVQGLDEEQAALFKNVVEQICLHSDKTMIYISHYKEEVPSCVDKFIQLEEGKISDTYIST